MTEFDKWFAQITKDYPLYQDKDGYNIGNIPALKVGWKAALEWLLAQETVKSLLGYKEWRYIDSIMIRNELKEE